jgi:hypothetical protein
MLMIAAILLTFAWTVGSKMFVKEMKAMIS